MKIRIALLTTAFVGSGLALPAFGQSASLGRDLAATCTHCHGTDGRSASIGLAGVAKDQIVQKMKEFKAGSRPATLMHQLSKGYTEQQVELIAEYFSKQQAR